MMQSMLLPKIVIVVLLLAIVATLFSGLFFLMKDGGNEKRRLLTALKIRVALSITLLAFLVLSYSMGWIVPHGLRP